MARAAVGRAAGTLWVSRHMVKNVIWVGRLWWEKYHTGRFQTLRGGCGFKEAGGEISYEIYSEPKKRMAGHWYIVRGELY